MTRTCRPCRSRGEIVVLWAGDPCTHPDHPRKAQPVKLRGIGRVIAATVKHGFHEPVVTAKRAKVA